MKHIEIKINDRTTVDIDTLSMVAIIREYSDLGCIMTINYPDNWSCGRIIQHCMTIVECSLGKSIII